jgi:hypothetical protein
MYHPTPIVAGTVKNLLLFYSETTRADGLMVESYPAGGATCAYGTTIYRLKNGRLVTTLPDDLLYRVIASREGWARANRFWHLLTGHNFGIADAFILPDRLAVAEEVAATGTYWSANPGRTHRCLAALNPDLVLEVWDPTLGKLVQAHVREAQSIREQGQTGHGAILELPSGMLERAQTAVDGLRARAMQAMRDELELD